jgi:alcohol dehydrogenase (NADP+)
MSSPSVKLFTGAAMPLLGLGTWKSSPGEVKAAVVSAIEGGYRHLDCAAVYGNEKEIGAALEECFSRGLVKRKDLFITSKLWASKCQPESVKAACEKTIADLKCGYLDLYLIHWPFFFTPDASFPPTKEQNKGYVRENYLAVWKEMEKLVDAGLTKHIGTSNASVKKLSELLPNVRIQPAVNQVESHPYLAQLRLKKYCDEHHIVLTAYSPLGSPDRPGDPAVKDLDPKPLADPVVKAIADAHGCSPAQVLLAFQMKRGVVTIPKSTNPERLRQNLDSCKLIEKLSKDEMKQLTALDGKARLIKGMAFTSTLQPTWEDLWDVKWEEENVAL